MTKVFLTGYQGETLNNFLKKLRAKDITVVVDVREIPLSRKNGFSKNHLSQALRKHNIEYHHFEELGSPSTLRAELKINGDYLDFFSSYREHAKKEGRSIRRLLNTIDSKHSALMCFEKNCELCHRTILASELLKRNRQLKVIPL